MLRRVKTMLHRTKIAGHDGHGRIAPRMRSLRKYPNRRLYDATSSRYVNLEEVGAYVRAGEEILVEDARDGRDRTREVLLQLVLEDEDSADLLPAALLCRVLRTREPEAREALAATLERACGEAALAPATSGAEAWEAAWQAWAGDAGAEAALLAPDELAPGEEPLDALRARLTSLEDRLRGAP
jgi:polyhydroxyalkanoate synthesis repressor PhaR